MQQTMTRPTPALALKAVSAADLMTTNPVSLRVDATVADALELFTTGCISAAPVIDEAGRPVGVLSNTDLMIHQRACGKGCNAGEGDATPVCELMTPGVFSVAPATPAASVVEGLLALNVHRLFVVDEQDVLVGVISAVDVLRHLRP